MVSVIMAVVLALANLLSRARLAPSFASTMLSITCQVSPSGSLDQRVETVLARQNVGRVLRTACEGCNTPFPGRVDVIGVRAW